MSYTYLKDRQYYENRYDDSTVNLCRRGEDLVNKTFTEMQKKLPAKELKQRKPGWYLHYSMYYFAFVEVPAAKRHAEREETITKWMQEDEDKDQKLAGAHISGGTYCRTCGKDMRLISKDYMRREGHKEDDILLMFECSSCNKRYAFWQDGTEWEGARIKCGKCGSDMKSSHKTKGKVITTTMTCTKCGHVETDVMDLSKDPVKEEPVDPYYELDRKRFVFGDDMIFKFQQKLQHFDRLRKLHADVEERTEHADIYDAIKDIKQLKIAQLGELLEKTLAKQQYTRFNFGEPQLSREVSVDFSCLDAKPEREEYHSKKDLQKLIAKTLEDTNWRLMSEGVSYRVGYLTGRLRAYESEEELKKLIEQKVKHGTLKPPVPRPTETQPVNNHGRTLKPEERNMRESALVYFQNMTLDSVPGEITLKSGIKKPHSFPVLSGEMNALLRVFIPMRDNDDSVPEFVRTFDFKFRGDDRIPKVTKDNLGRKIRRTDNATQKDNPKG